MTRILSAAGLPKDVLELVTDIFDTCKECRKWTKPGKEAVATFCVSTKFNEHVERLWDSYKYNLQVKDNKKMVVEVAKEKFSHNSVVTMMSSNVLCVTYANGTKVEMYYKVNDTTKEVAFTIRNTKIETPKNQDDLFKLLDTLGKL
jgi:hypothetical protein